jgi:hypothetical protein
MLSVPNGAVQYVARVVESMAANVAHLVAAVDESPHVGVGVGYKFIYD